MSTDFSQPDFHASLFPMQDEKPVRQTAAISGLKLLPLSNHTGPMLQFLKTCLASRRWHSQACDLSWTSKPVSRAFVITSTERKNLASLTTSQMDLKKRDIPSSRLLFQLVPRTRNTDATASGSSPSETIWQTPVSDDAVNRTKGKINSRGEPKLSAQVKMWPTPRVGGEEKLETVIARKGLTAAKKHNLLAAVQLGQMFPTPQASDTKDRGNRSTPAIQRRIAKGKQINLSMTVSDVSGQLNPRFVEWLMGYPDGWTELKALETP